MMCRHTGVLAVLAAAGLSAPALAQAPAAEAAPTAPSPRATYLFGPERWHEGGRVGWDGFLTGLRGFEHFYTPVGQPIYFEPPFNDTGLRFIYLHHSFSDKSQLAGGSVDVAAMALRVALTERWQFIAIKDGYSWLDAGALPKDEGWNEIGAGVKYVFYVDPAADMLAAAGVRVILDSGEGRVAQWGTTELSPFVTFAKGWDRFHVVGTATWRVPFDGDDGNQVFMWDLHADAEILPDTLPGLAPMVELHGVHYLTDGERLGLKVGGLDYANFGSTDVAGSSVIWAGFGARWKLNPHTSVGAAYEIGLTNHNADIMKDRVTVDFELKW